MTNQVLVRCDADPDRKFKALRIRARAAQGLVESGQLDGELALSYIVWPTPEMDGLAADVATPLLSDPPSASCVSSSGNEKAP